MIVEFDFAGKTYSCAVGVAQPTDLLRIVFRPCVLKPPFILELRYLGHDEIRGCELYKPEGAA